MQLNSYNKAFTTYFNSAEIKNGINQSISIVNKVDTIFFIGNGGSNSICSHMMEDYMKIAGKKTQAFSDPALITCFANDYGYEMAMARWLEFNINKNDLLVAISSSGESPNILNATREAKKVGAKIITLSGFDPNNSLSQMGDVNLITPIDNYGIVECFHQTILHVILDSLDDNK